MPKDTELDRRTVLGVLGTTTVVTGLAGCIDNDAENESQNGADNESENGGEDSEATDGEDGQDSENMDDGDGEDMDGEDGEDGEETDGQDGEDTDGEDGEDTDGEDGEDGTTVEGDVTVQLSETAFEPVLVEIEPGQTVVWVNEDDDAHDVTASQFTDAAAEWSLSVAPPPGEAVSHTFEEAGVYEYFCTIHGESTSCGAVVVGDPETVRPLSCMGIDQIQQYFDTLDVLDPERPYGIDVNLTTDTTPGTVELNLRVNQQGDNLLTATTQAGGNQTTLEIYLRGNTATVYSQNIGECRTVTYQGGNVFEAIQDAGGENFGANAGTGQLGDVTDHERQDELQSALVPVGTTTIDGVRTIVFDVDVETFNEVYDGTFENVDIQEFNTYIRTDNWHVVRQEIEYTTGQGRVSTEIEYHAFGEPFIIMNPC